MPQSLRIRQHNHDNLSLPSGIVPEERGLDLPDFEGVFSPRSRCVQHDVAATKTSTDGQIATFGVR